MILDNAGDIDMLFQPTDIRAKQTKLTDYLPQSSTGSIVFITRNHNVPTRTELNSVVEIPDMDEDSAYQLLTKLLFHSKILNNRDTVSALLNQLAFLPLAIAQAAAYINENDVSIADYLLLLENTDAGIIELFSEECEEKENYQSQRTQLQHHLADLI